MADRSTADVVLMFLVLSPLAGVALLCWVAVNAVAHAGEFVAADWFWQVGWAGLLGVALTIGPPAAGWRELQRRREVVAQPAPPPTSPESRGRE